MRWLGQFPKPPRITYLVHGEPVPMDMLKAKIEERLKWTAHAPQHLEEVQIG
jgi:metallo-beta-lactamase family protein